jgi:hypothetical protein
MFSSKQHTLCKYHDHFGHRSSTLKLIKCIKIREFTQDSIGCIVRYCCVVPDEQINEAFNTCEYCISVVKSLYGVAIVPSHKILMDTIMSSSLLYNDVTEIICGYLLFDVQPTMVLQIHYDAKLAMTYGSGCINYLNHLYMLLHKCLAIYHNNVQYV